MHLVDAVAVVGLMAGVVPSSAVRIADAAPADPSMDAAASTSSPPAATKKTNGKVLDTGNGHDGTAAAHRLRLRADQRNQQRQQHQEEGAAAASSTASGKAKVTLRSYDEDVLRRGDNDIVLRGLQSNQDGDAILRSLPDRGGINAAKARARARARARERERERAETTKTPFGATATTTVHNDPLLVDESGIDGLLNQEEGEEENGAGFAPDAAELSTTDHQDADVGLLPGSHASVASLTYTPGDVLTAADSCPDDTHVNCINGEAFQWNNSTVALGVICGRACGVGCCTTFDSCSSATACIQKDPANPSCDGRGACYYAGNSDSKPVITNGSCVGERACSKLAASSGVVPLVDSSCLDYESCIYLAAEGYSGSGGTVGPIQDSCKGHRACYNVAFDGGRVGAIRDSCRGWRPCNYVASFDGKVGVIQDSCKGDVACEHLAYQHGKVGVIQDSCKGDVACNRLAYQHGEVGAIQDSCKGFMVCWRVAAFGGQVGDIQDSCCRSYSDDGVFYGEYECRAHCCSRFPPGSNSTSWYNDQCLSTPNVDLPECGQNLTSVGTDTCPSAAPSAVPSVSFPDLIPPNPMPPSTCSENYDKITAEIARLEEEREGLSCDSGSKKSAKSAAGISGGSGKSRSKNQNVVPPF